MDWWTVLALDLALQMKIKKKKKKVGQKYISAGKKFCNSKYWMSCSVMSQADLPTPGGRNQGVFPSKSGRLDINQGDLP